MKRLSTAVVLGIATVVFIGGALAQSRRDGPFGLAKGLKVTEIEQVIGGKLDPPDGEPFLYATKKVPRPHTAFETYALQILPDAGLCQIRAVGKDIQTSSQGVQLRLEFDDLSKTLGEVYGTGERIDRLFPGSIWKNPEDWMMGLLKKERLLGIRWTTSDANQLRYDLIDIALAARATKSDTGYLFLQYDFNNKEACQEELRRAEKSAL